MIPVICLVCIFWLLYGLIAFSAKYPVEYDSMRDRSFVFVLITAALWPIAFKVFNSYSIRN